MRVSWSAARAEERGTGKGGGRTVVLGPPREVAAADDVVEDEPDDRRRHVVGRRRGRDEARPAEDDGEVDVFEERVRPLERDEVAPERRERACEEEEHQAARIGVDIS